MEAGTHAYSEGTWTSPGYRSGRTRANITLVLFGIVAVAGLASLGANLELLKAAESEDLSGLDALIENLDATGNFFVLSAFALAVAFLAWLSRTVEITPVLGGGTPRTSPAWSIIWWFVPIAFLWKPYTVVREVWERLATPERKGGAWLVVSWWVAWIATGVVDRAAARLSSSAADWVALERAAGLAVGSSFLALTAAILGFFVVREIQARADLRARVLGFEAALPGVPASAPAAGQGPAGIGAAPTAGQSAEERRPTSRVSTPGGAQSDLADSLRTLRSLRDEGLTSDEEYGRRRTELLDRL